MTLDISAIRQRIEKATPGPWMLDKPKPGDDGFSLGVKIAQTAGASIYAAPPSGQFPVRDAELIAHAPADLRALCDEVERLGKALIRYGTHDRNCPEFSQQGNQFNGGITQDSAFPCSCGLAEQLNATEAKEISK